MRCLIDDLNLQAGSASELHCFFVMVSQCYCSFDDVSLLERHSAEAVSPATPSVIEAIQKCNSFSFSRSFHMQLGVHRHLYCQPSALSLFEQMRLTTVMEDTRMVSRFVPIEQ